MRGMNTKYVETLYIAEIWLVLTSNTPTSDCLADKIPTVTAWEGSRLKVVSMDALRTFKRVAAWFPGPVQDTERLLTRLRRLNRGLDIRNWEVLRAQGGAQRRPPCAHYRHAIRRRVRGTALEALQRCGTGRFLPSGHEAGRKKIENKEEEEEEEWTDNMVSTITFLQANLQHSIAASGILTRTVGVAGVDMALMQETRYRDGCVGGLRIPG